MFSSAVSVGTRLNAWKTKPTRSRRSRVSSRSAERGELGVADPAPGPTSTESSPARQCISVRLARAGRAHDRGEAPAPIVDVDRVEGDDPGVALAVDLGQRARRGGRYRSVCARGDPRARPSRGLGGSGLLDGQRGRLTGSGGGVPPQAGHDRPVVAPVAEPGRARPPVAGLVRPLDRRPQRLDLALGRAQVGLVGLVRAAPRRCRGRAAAAARGTTRSHRHSTRA